MFKVRFISGFFVLLFTLVFGFAGGIPLAVGLAVISVIAYLEYTKATKVRIHGTKINGLEMFGVGTIVVYYFLLLFYEIVSMFPQGLSDWLFANNGFFNNYSVIILLVFTLGVVSILFAYIFTFPKYNNNQVANAIFGLIYVAFMLSFIYYTRELPNGHFLVWLIFISSWVCDTCAYAVGSLCGKHKMTPNLSPKKTYEGAAGGILGTILASLIFGFVFIKHFELSYILLISFGIIGLFGALFSMCGDLVASAIKRNNDVKDYGKIIPGHGGILDRFDSVLFAAPLVYFLIVLLMGSNIPKGKLTFLFF